MNENHSKDKKIKSKKKSKNLKIDLSDTSNTSIISNTSNTSNTKITKKSKPVENNKSVENNKNNDYINNLTLECFMNASQYERYVKNNNGHLQNNNNIGNDDFVHNDEEILFYKDRILNLLEKMFNKEFPNDTLKSIFNILINNSINYLQEQDTFDLYQENYDNVINDSKNKNISNMPNVSNMTTESIITSDLKNYIIKKEDTLLEDFVTKKKINLPISKSSSRFPKRKNLNLKTQELKNKGLK